MNTTVSIIIPTYKRPDTLPRAIESVLNQTYNNIELIVVDDNDPFSSYREETEKIMNNYRENKRVLYICHDKNKNGSAARNTGFINSTGEYLMFLDDDDEFMPNKVSSQLDFLIKNSKEYGGCYTRYNRIIDNSVLSISKEEREGYLGFELLKRNLWVAAGSNLMIRREVFHELNGFDETFSRNQDVELLLRLCLKYKLGFVNIHGLNIYVCPKMKKVDFVAITNHFIHTFQGHIQSLNVEQRIEVYWMLNLQAFRFWITNYNFYKALQQLLTRKVYLIDAFDFIMYLANRKRNGISCGYYKKPSYRYIKQHKNASFIF